MENHWGGLTVLPRGSDSDPGHKGKKKEKFPKRGKPTTVLFTKIIREEKGRETGRIAGNMMGVKKAPSAGKRKWGCGT